MGEGAGKPFRKIVAFGVGEGSWGNRRFGFKRFDLGGAAVAAVTGELSPKPAAPDLGSAALQPETRPEIGPQPAA